MTSKEALEKICKEWHCSMAYAYKRCPWRGISGDYCEEYETIKKDLEVLEELTVLKDYYPPFKEFLKDMFAKGENEDLEKLKEWLER